MVRATASVRGDGVRHLRLMRGFRAPGQARRRRHSRSYVEEAQRRQGRGGPPNYGVNF